jgi:hypothetical protein
LTENTDQLLPAGEESATSPEDGASSVSDSGNRRIKKRFLIPGVLLAASFLVLLWGGIRGTWADSVAKTPKSASDGIRTQLLLTAKGRKVVRCAQVLKGAPKDYWEVITDYDNFAKSFDQVEDVNIETQPDKKIHLTYIAIVGWARVPVDVMIENTESSDQFQSSWTGEGDVLVVNNGSWTLTPVGSNETLLVYQLDLEHYKVPDFVVRNIVLDQVESVVNYVVSEVRRRGQKAE